MGRKKNPIDKEKTTDNPGLLPYANHIGSAIIRPVESGKEKGLGMKAMYQQTERNLKRIRQQVELLISQAQEIHDRISFSERIYLAECAFDPLIGQVYYLYKRLDESEFLSMVGPLEWGDKNGLSFVCSARLLADHTWEILELGSAEKKKARSD